MRTERNAVGPLLVLFVLSALLTGLVAGCGGGDRSGNGGQEGQQGGDAAEQGGGAPRDEGSDSKIALGTIRAVKPDKNRISLKPTVEDQGDGALAFKVADDADITLDGEQAEIADVKGGQQVQIEYVDGEGGVNRALSLQLFAAQGQQPSGEDGQSN